MKLYEKWDSLRDEELVSDYQAGNQEVGEYIILRFHRMIMQCAGVLFINGGDREDLIQEGRLGLYEAIQTYDQSRDVSFEAFARVCVSRAQYKAIEASNRKKHQPLNQYVHIDSSKEETEQLSTAYHITDPEALYLNAESVLDLHKRIQNSLSLLEREVLEYLLEGFSYTQIANILGKDKKSIDNCFQRIRNKVRHMLKEQNL